VFSLRFSEFEEMSSSHSLCPLTPRDLPLFTLPNDIIFLILEYLTLMDLFYLQKYVSTIPNYSSTPGDNPNWNLVQLFNFCNGYVFYKFPLNPGILKWLHEISVKITKIQFHGYNEQSYEYVKRYKHSILEMDFSNCTLNNTSLNQIGRCSSLTSLRLASCLKINDNGLRKFLKSNPLLEKLDLCKTPNLSSTVILQFGPYGQQLTQLDVSMNPWFDRLCLVSLAELPRLKSVNISYTTIGIQSIIEFLKAKPNLQSIGYRVNTTTLNHEDKSLLMQVALRSTRSNDIESQMLGLENIRNLLNDAPSDEKCWFQMLSIDLLSKLMNIFKQYPRNFESYGRLVFELSHKASSEELIPVISFLLTQLQREVDVDFLLHVTYTLLDFIDASTSEDHIARAIRALNVAGPILSALSQANTYEDWFHDLTNENFIENCYMMLTSLFHPTYSLILVDSSLISSWVKFLHEVAQDNIRMEYIGPILSNIITSSSNLKLIIEFGLVSAVVSRLPSQLGDDDFIQWILDVTNHAMIVRGKDQRDETTMLLDSLVELGILNYLIRSSTMKVLESGEEVVCNGWSLQSVMNCLKMIIRFDRKYRSQVNETALMKHFLSLYEEGSEGVDSQISQRAVENDCLIKKRRKSNDR
jgi:hypothetical protein